MVNTTIQEEIESLGIIVDDLQITPDGCSYTGNLTDEQSIIVSNIAKRHMELLKVAPTIEDRLKNAEALLSRLLEETNQ